MNHVVLAGPTAAGKTEVALALARERAGWEIINADSRQTLAGLTTATCAPTPEMHAVAPHHLFGYRPPGHPPTAAEWLADAEAVLAEVAARGHCAVVVGGTGLYLRALLRGLDDTGPAPDPILRRRRTEAATSPDGLRSLQQELQRRDPEGSARVDMANPRRVIRALEILDATGQRLGAIWRSEAAARRFTGVVLAVPVEELSLRIELRAGELFGSGAIQREVTDCLAAGVSEAALAASGIGYREAIDLADGRLTQSEAVARTVERTRRYAKAQRTFFRSLPELRPVTAMLAPAVLSELAGLS